MPDQQLLHDLARGLGRPTPGLTERIARMLAAARARDAELGVPGEGEAPVENDGPPEDLGPAE